MSASLNAVIIFSELPLTFETERVSSANAKILVSTEGTIHDQVSWEMMEAFALKLIFTESCKCLPHGQFCLSFP